MKMVDRDATDEANYEYIIMILHQFDWEEHRANAGP